jgi:hypothetical protein
VLVIITSLLAVVAVGEGEGKVAGVCDAAWMVVEEVFGPQLLKTSRKTIVSGKTRRILIIILPLQAPDRLACAQRWGGLIAIIIIAQNRENRAPFLQETRIFKILETLRFNYHLSRMISIRLRVICASSSQIFYVI